MLICGANGFLGKNAVEKFMGKYQIRAVDLNLPSNPQPGVEWIQADLTKKEDVQKVMKDVDVVLQYAAVSTGIRDAIERPYLHVTDNVVMNSFLMREAFEQNVEHFIFPSCTVMYNAAPNPVVEDDFNGVLDENSAYFGGGGMKVYLENVCKFYSKLGKTKFTVIRQSNLYGPHDKFQLEKSHVFAASITKVMIAQEGGEVVVWGDGSEKKDFIYVGDLMNFIELALNQQQSQFELVNLGGGEAVSIKNLVETIVDASKKNVKISYDLTKPTRKVSLEINSDKAKTLFNWQPKTDIKSGIGNVITWYRQNILK